MYLSSICGSRLRVISLVTVCSLAIIAGCSKQEVKRFRAQGAVTFDGKPVPAGTVYFDPNAQKGNKGPQGFATIVDGKYDTNNGGQGHVGGAMKIRIVGLSASAKARTDDSPIPPLFPEFVDAIDLKSADETRDFSVPKDYAGAPVQDAASGGP